MIKMLSRKFIRTSMIVVSILLIMLVGAINIINIGISNKRSMQDLAMISQFYDTNFDRLSEPEARPDKPEIEPGNRPPQNEGAGRNEYDTFMASNFFFVVFDAMGECERVDISRTSQVDENEAIEIAEDILASGKESGKYGAYLFSLRNDNPSNSKIVILLDCSHSRRQMRLVLISSLLVALVCWLIMLAIASLLSKKAIKPIAENLERQKQFVTDAGHEIKTPLAIIQSNAEAMELYEGKNKWIKNILLQVERLNGLTQDLLLLAKIDEATIVHDKEEVPAGKVLEEMLDGFARAATKKKINFDAAITEGVIISARKSDIEKLFSILIDNAIKYGSEASTIKLQLAKHKTGIKFTIENDCKELPEVEAEKLFERFFRCDKSRSQSKGNGIGLSIAKSIVEAYGGEIQAEYLNKQSIRFTAII